MRLIVTAGHPGGAGASTLAINLAQLASTAGHRVLLLDTDPTGAIAAALGLELTRAAPSRGLWRAELDAQLTIGQLASSLERLPEVVERLREEGWDLLIIDGPSPWVARLAPPAADVIVALRAAPLSLQLLPTRLEELRDEAQERGRAPRFVVTLPRAEGAGGAWARSLQARLGSLSLGPPVPFCESVGLALLEGRSVTASLPTSPAARAYRRIAEALDLAPMRVVGWEAPRGAAAAL